MAKHYYRPKPKYQEEAEAIERAKKKAMRVHLRKTLADFLSAMQVKEGDPKYEDLVAIWRDFHED